MGLGSLKILSPQEVPHYKVLNFLLFIRHSSEPGIHFLLWGLRQASCHADRFFAYNTSIVDYGFSPFTARIPCVSALLPIPCMLGAVVTNMSLFMAGVTLNFV